MDLPENYRIEVSGWGLDQAFFAEYTQLPWFQDGEKNVTLHHALPERAIVFVRLLTAHTGGNSAIPIAYRVDRVQLMNCDGQCEMRLTQLHPRSKESIASQVASKVCDEPLSSSEATEVPKCREVEEVLQ